MIGEIPESDSMGVVREIDGNDDILRASDQGEGVVICKICGLSADSRLSFFLSLQTPGKS
jgi:hypothetical protein